MNGAGQQIGKAQEAAGAGRLAGGHRSRARKDERESISEMGTNQCKGSEVTLRSTRRNRAQLTARRGALCFREGTLICSLKNLELFCITGFYNVIFISSLMP